MFGYYSCVLEKKRTSMLVSKRQLYSLPSISLILLTSFRLSQVDGLLSFVLTSTHFVKHLRTEAMRLKMHNQLPAEKRNIFYMSLADYLEKIN